MDIGALRLKLIAMGKAKATKVIYAGVCDYLQLLAHIASDIYDSCIQDFYQQYTPTSYSRHGDIAGFNLYEANQISYENGIVNVDIDEWSLSPYGKHDKRDVVFDFMASGLRGGPLPKQPDFPMDWLARYPNEYSRYGHIWQSSGTTLYDIFDEFFDTVVSDTVTTALSYIAKRV